MNDAPQEPVTTESFSPGWLGLLLLVLVLLPLRIMTAGDSDSFWVDEAYTVLIITRPVEFVVAITTLDAHPPLFYLLTKAIVDGASSFGIEPNVLILRTPSLIAFFLMIASGWLLGRFLLGNMGGCLYALLLAVNGPMASYSAEARNYSMLMLLVGTAFLLLMSAWKLERTNSWTRPRAFALWCLYTICAAIPLWLHLLATIAMFHLGLLWVALVLVNRRWRSPFVIGGFIAHTVAVVQYIPWLLQAGKQLDYLSNTPTPWMSAPDFINWGMVFLYWYPMCRLGLDVPAHRIVALVLICLAPLPIAAWLGTWFARGRRNLLDVVVIPSIAGMMVAICFVTTLWMLSRFQVVKAFHGPRYPVIMLPVWLFAMTGLSMIAAGRFRLPRWGTSLLLAPLLLAGVYGQLAAQDNVKRFGRGGQIEELRPILPPPGSILHFSPSSMIPYLQPSFNGYTLVPVEEMEDLADPTGPHHLLILQYWMEIQTPLSRLVASFARGDLLARRSDVVYLPHNSAALGDISIYTLRDINERVTTRVFKTPEIVRGMNLADAISTALPEQQSFLDGFSVLELLDEGDPFCWAIGGHSKIRFDRPLPPGDYTLTVSLLRHPYPESEQELVIRFEGENSELRPRLGDGYHQLRLPYTITRNQQWPVLRINHPVWRPSDHFEGSLDTRPLTFLFMGATMHSAE